MKCLGLTKTKGKCPRNGGKNGYCWQHHEQFESSPEYIKLYNRLKQAMRPAPKKKWWKRW